MKRERLLTIWANMKTRCYNPRVEKYARYGARGIRVCEEWKPFAGFKAWALDSGYRDDLQIDRIDNDGGYWPDNCRWVTPKQNCRNKSTNRRLSTGETYAEAAARIGIAENTLYERLRQHGWSETKALSTPLRRKRQ